MKGLLADLKHAARVYGRTPVSSAIAVVVLAVGMAFVGAFLSLYVDLALKPHPGIEDSREIVTIGQVDGNRFTGMPVGLIDRMAEEMSSLDTVIGTAATRLPVGQDGELTVFEMVTSGFFEGLRPRLAMGRGLEPADYEADAEPVLVLSDSYWRGQFDAAPDVLGTTLLVPSAQSLDAANADAEDGAAEFRIVGVMAPRMRGLLNDAPAFWVPFEQVLPIFYAGGQVDIEQIRPQLTLSALGRLGEGATAQAALSELEGRYSESTDEYRLQPGFRFDVVNGLVRNIQVHRDSERQLRLFLAASVLLAVVAAANVSLFLLARAPGRRRELAIRMSVGAPLRRLGRQLASEAGLLVVVAAALGLVASVWLVNFLRRLSFLQQADLSDVSLLDWRVLSLIGLFLFLVTMLVSLAPIVGLKRLGIASTSRQLAARATLAQRIAGTMQIAIAGPLGGAAIAFGWYLGSMTLGYPGYELEDRYFVQFPFSANTSARSGAVTFESALAETMRHGDVIEAIPGVSAFSQSNLVPASRSVVSTRTMMDPNDLSREIVIGSGSIDSRFVDVLGLRLLYGRVPAPNETGAALVNQSLARLFFGRENVLGETLAVPNVSGPRTEIVGVLEDLSFVHPAADVGPILFTMQPQFFGLNGVIESSLPAAELQQQMQALIDSGELELGRPRLRPLSELRRNLIAPDRARSLLTISTASLVVLLATLGFYGTQRYLVMAGRREYAIRASLGAGPKALGRLVFRRGFLLSLPGLVLGSMLAFIVVAWLRDDFISREIPPGTVTLIVVVGLASLLMAASLGPARQARRTQPAPLLRED